MPASRRQRATTLAPRSCPSSPTLATRTRMRGEDADTRRKVGAWLDARGPVLAYVFGALDYRPSWRTRGRPGGRTRGCLGGDGRGGSPCAISIRGRAIKRGRRGSLGRRCRLRLEDLAHLGGQRVGREGLGEEGHAGPEDTVADDGIIRVARHVEHLHVGTQGGEPLGELATAHLRHDDVRDHEVDGTLVPPADLERLGAVTRLR